MSENNKTLKSNPIAFSQANFGISDEIKKLPITAAVLTLNAETKIKKCLESLSFCAEIIVVDSGSTDRTLQVAKEFGAKIFYDEFENLSAQKQYALNHSTNSWVLLLNADERVEYKLYEFLKNLDFNSSKNDGYRLRILHHFLGRWIYHSGLYPDYKLRLFKKEKTSICKEDPYGLVKVDGAVKNIDYDLLRYHWDGLKDFFAKQFRKADKVAEIKFAKAKRSSFVGSLLDGKFSFVDRYIFKLGFLDGYAGLIYCLSTAIVSTYASLRIWELNKKYSTKNFVPQNLLFRALLFPLQQLYSLAVNLRVFAYKKNFLKSQTLDVPVISVGNLTVGGSGKTPFVVWLTKSLSERGIRNISILSRGYGSQPSNKEEPVTQLSLSREVETLKRIKEKSQPRIVEITSLAKEVGDEPLFLKKQLNAFGINVLVSPSRIEAGLYAVNNLHSQLLVLDDGFQHLKLKRNLNICLVDCSDSFGFDLLPLGTARESFQELKRADIIILTRSEINPYLKNKYLQKIKKYAPEKEILVLKEEIKKFTVGFTPLQEFLQNKKVLAFCALGNPLQFFLQLKNSGVNIKKTFSFRDHHFYSKKDLGFLEELRQSEECDYLLTTAKDAVKIAQVKDSKISQNIIVAHQELIGLYRLQDGIPIHIDDLIGLELIKSLDLKEAKEIG